MNMNLTIGEITIHSKAGEKRLWLPLLLLLLPLVFMIVNGSGLSGFPYASEDALYSDVSISHYPLALFLQRSVFEHASLPLWSPLILSGFPFAADPLSGMWYPFGWLALLLPLPLGFNMMVSLHLIWAGIGMFAYLRAQHVPEALALLGGLALQMLPKLFAHYGAGHLSLMYAISWTPWLLLALEQNLKAQPESWRGWTGWPGVLLGLTILADPRWGAYSALLWFGWYLAHSQKVALQIGWKVLMGRALWQVGLAGLLASPLMVPMIEFTRFSSRTSMSHLDVLFKSLSPGQLLGLMFPNLTGDHEMVLYGGAMALASVLLALVWGRSLWHQQPQVRFWLVVLLTSLLFASGENMPGMMYLVQLPGFNLLRVPSRALFITGLALIVIMTHVTVALMNTLSPSMVRRGRLTLVALAAVAVLIAGLLWGVTGKLESHFAWGAAMTLVACLWIGIRFSQRLSVQVWLVGLFLLCLLDWGFVDWQRLYLRKPAEVVGEQQAVVTYLAAKLGEAPGPFRVYSSSHSIPQQSAAFYQLDLADGIDPLHLQSYLDWIIDISNVPRQHYAVTVPQHEESATIYQPETAGLGLLNVAYVAAEYDLHAPGLALEQQFGDTRVYRNQLVRPRAWVQAISDPLPSSYEAMLTDASSQTFEPATIEQLEPNQIRLQTQPLSTQPQAGYLLVLSEVNYPGWQVQVDGQPAQIETLGGLLRAVRLEPGAHRVTFTFRPRSVALGLTLGLLGWLLVGFAWIRSWHG